MNFLNVILDYIFPPTCTICNKFGQAYLCKECEKELEKYLYNNKEKDVFHLFVYKEIIREKMIQFKFNDKSYMYHMFCEIFVKNKKACEFLKSYDIIIPVPIHKKRKHQRGYNQSELIARELASKLGVTIYTDILKKTKNTKPQSLLDAKDRKKNTQGVYIVENSEKIKNKNVVILDDIYTTGATVNECKKMIKLAGAKNVGILTIAKD